MTMSFLYLGLVVVVLIGVIYGASSLMGSWKHRGTVKVLGHEDPNDPFVFVERRKGVFEIEGRHALGRVTGTMIMGDVAGAAETEAVLIRLLCMLERPPLHRFEMTGVGAVLVEGDPPESFLVGLPVAGLARAEFAMNRGASQGQGGGDTYDLHVDALRALHTPGVAPLWEESRQIGRFLDHIGTRDGGVTVTAVIPLDVFEQYRQSKTHLLALCTRLQAWALAWYYTELDELLFQVEQVFERTPHHRSTSPRTAALSLLLLSMPQIETRRPDMLSVVARELDATDRLDTQALECATPSLYAHLSGDTLTRLYGKLLFSDERDARHSASLALVTQELTRRLDFARIRAAGSPPWSMDDAWMQRWHAGGCSLLDLCDVTPPELVSLASRQWFFHDPERLNDPGARKAVMRLLARCHERLESTILNELRGIPSSASAFWDDLFMLLEKRRFEHIDLNRFVVERSGRRPPHPEYIWRKVVHSMDYEWVKAALVERFEDPATWRLIATVDQGKHGNTLRGDALFGLDTFRLFEGLFSQPTQEMRHDHVALARLTAALHRNREWAAIQDGHKARSEALCERIIGFFDHVPMTRDVFIALEYLSQNAPEQLRARYTAALSRWSTRGVQGGLTEVDASRRGGLSMK